MHTGRGCCPSQPEALLLGLPTRPWQLLCAGSGRPTLDLAPEHPKKIVRAQKWIKEIKALGEKFD